MRIYLSSMGLDPAGDNSGVINHAIETAIDGAWLIFPNGDFPVHKPLVQNNKGLTWAGAENTNLLFYHGGTGIELTRHESTSRTLINKVNFLSRYNGNSITQHGIVSHVPISIKSITIENFHGDGMRLTADVVTSPGADVSFFRGDSIVVKVCSGNGIYLQGGDANQGNFYHIDIRDNGGYGILDDSFLGNQFFGCMAHLNKKGDYAAINVNSRSGFFGCYAEEGSPLSYFHGSAQIFGGLWGGGVILEHNAVAYIYNGNVPTYDMITHGVESSKMYKIFKRTYAPFEYQWRVYKTADGDQFEEKSIENIQSEDQCIKGAIDYINSKK